MEYTYLTAEDMDGILRRRIHSLEADHYLASLALWEHPDDPVARRDVAELSRRIRRHGERSAAPVPAETDGFVSEDTGEPAVT